MLRAATNLVTAGVSDSSEDAIGEALAHIRLTDVAAEATRLIRGELHASGTTVDAALTPVTTGAIYQTWPTQADFQVDLLFHLADLNATSDSVLDELPAVIDAAVSDGAPVEETIRAIVERSFEYTRESALFYASLCFYLRAGNARVREALRRSTDTFIDQIRPIWTRLLETYDLELREPYTIDDLALAISSMIEGLSLEWISNPSRVGDPVGAPNWSLAGRVTLMVFEGMTRRREQS